MKQFPNVFSILLENFLPFSSTLELLSANSFSFEESKICRLGKSELSLYQVFNVNIEPPP